MSPAKSTHNNKAAATDLTHILCSTATDREACERFVERLEEAHNNIRPRIK